MLEESRGRREEKILEAILSSEQKSSRILQERRGRK
jgi:hypothetical protein